MRTLVHLSDLHFGRVDPIVVRGLVERVLAIAPDLVVISGDLTQRARASEFRAARALLDELPRPQLIVPGNHDIPLYNVFRRFARPLGRYRSAISDDLEPTFADSEIAVFGVNTARSATFKDGRINRPQIETLRTRLQSIASDIVKVVVSHHPFDLPSGYREGVLVGRAPEALRMFSRHQVDVILAGHLHASHAGSTVSRYPKNERAILFVQAGTATSTRRRGETNAFNVIRIDSPRIEVERITWSERLGELAHDRTKAFQRTDAGWVEDTSRNLSGG